jgi:hypothetical protein
LAASWLLVLCVGDFSFFSGFDFGGPALKAAMDVLPLMPGPRGIAAATPS